MTVQLKSSEPQEKRDMGKPVIVILTAAKSQAMLSPSLALNTEVSVYTAITYIF